MAPPRPTSAVLLYHLRMAARLTQAVWHLHCQAVSPPRRLHCRCIPCSTLLACRDNSPCRTHLPLLLTEIIMAVRDVERGEQAAASIRTQHPKAKLTVMHCDLASLASVRTFTETFKQLQKPCHILLANAGVMACPFGRTADGHELQFGINHLGHFALVQQLMPVLRDTAEGCGEPGRVVVLSSAAHFTTYPSKKGGPVRLQSLDSEYGYHPYHAYVSWVARSSGAGCLVTQHQALAPLLIPKTAAMQPEHAHQRSVAVSFSDFINPHNTPLDSSMRLLLAAMTAAALRASLLTGTCMHITYMSQEYAALYTPPLTLLCRPRASCATCYLCESSTRGWQQRELLSLW